jgi:hypothetical protein
MILTDLVSHTRDWLNAIAHSNMCSIDLTDVVFHSSGRLNLTHLSNIQVMSVTLLVSKWLSGWSNELHPLNIQHILFAVERAASVERAF